MDRGMNGQTVTDRYREILFLYVFFFFIYWYAQKERGMEGEYLKKRDWGMRVMEGRAKERYNREKETHR